MAVLTALAVKNLKKPGRYGDSGGLYLYVAPNGSKSWVQRISTGGKRRDLGLGGYPSVSLTEARGRAVANKAAVREGRDPDTSQNGKKRSASAKAELANATPTFRKAAGMVHPLNAAKWDNSKTTSNWWQRAERYVFPAIGDVPLDRIGRTEVLDILTPVWTLKPETARRIRLIIKTVMSWGMAYGYITVNPAGAVIDAALPPMPKIKEHFKALPYPEIAAAIKSVEASTAFPATKLAFRFLVLTAARSGEVRRATWDEIDMGNTLWTISADRMKSRKEHRVPLSTGAMAVLKEAQSLPTNGSPLVFPNDLTPSKALSDNALSYMLRRIHVPAVAHGFRSSFRDWAAEKTDASFAVMELALAHGVGSGVVQSYARPDLLDRRRSLMQAWSDFLGL